MLLLVLSVYCWALCVLSLCVRKPNPCWDFIICRSITRCTHLHVDGVIVLPVDVLVLVLLWCLDADLCSVNTTHHVWKSVHAEEHFLFLFLPQVGLGIEPTGEPSPWMLPLPFVRCGSPLTGPRRSVRHKYLGMSHWRKNAMQVALAKRGQRALPIRMFELIFEFISHLQSIRSSESKLPKQFWIIKFVQRVCPVPKNLLIFSGCNVADKGGHF